MGYRDRSTIKDNELLIEVDIDIEIRYFMFPFLIHFVLKGELDIISVDFHRVDKE